MKRFTVLRLVASFTLLVHSSAYGATTLLDGLVASRANAAVAHVEADGSATCPAAHDEATCQLCRVAATTIYVAPQHFAIAALVSSGRPNGGAREHQASIALTALHSRAPPLA